jgi:hypothetical protein
MECWRFSSNGGMLQVNLYRKVLLVLSGFSSAGAGKLIGPDGQEMDNEAFLSDLTG